MVELAAGGSGGPPAPGFGAESAPSLRCGEESEEEEEEEEEDEDVSLRSRRGNSDLAWVAFAVNGQVVFGPTQMRARRRQLDRYVIDSSKAGANVVSVTGGELWRRLMKYKLASAPMRMCSMKYIVYCRMAHSVQL